MMKFAALALSLALALAGAGAVAVAAASEPAPDAAPVPASTPAPAPAPAAVSAPASASASRDDAPLQAPGLWEHTLDLASSGGELDMAQVLAERQMAAMPPAQRDALKAMLARRGIVLGHDARSAKTCLTAAQAALPLPPLPQLGGGGCSATQLSRNGKAVRYGFSCTRPIQVTGEGEVVFTDLKHYTGQATGTTSMVGLPQKMNIRVDGRWLGADCHTSKAAPKP